MREIKIKSIYGADARIIEQAQSQGRLRFKFHTEEYPLTNSGLRVCDIYIKTDDSNINSEDKKYVYPKLLN